MGISQITVRDASNQYVALNLDQTDEKALWL